MCTVVFSMPGSVQYDLVVCTVVCSVGHGVQRIADHASLRLIAVRLLVAPLHPLHPLQQLPTGWSLVKSLLLAVCYIG